MNEFTPFEVAVALARLEYGVPLTEYNRLVLDWASTDLIASEEAVLEIEDGVLT